MAERITQALDILRELDTASAGAEDRCEEACKTLLDPQAEQLLKVIGWDLLHTFLPFVSVASASCRAAARQLLLRVAALCNPREIFSMVLEGLSLFKVSQPLPPRAINLPTFSVVYRSFIYPSICIHPPTYPYDDTHTAWHANRAARSVGYSFKCMPSSCPCCESKVAISKITRRSLMH